MTSPGRHEIEAHSAHDPLLVAASVAGDLPPGDAREARARLAACPLCTALADDLRAIASATRALRDVPRPAPADRSFILDDATATALARGRAWRALLRPFGRSAAVGPVGGALAALGLAGFLLAAIPGPALTPTFTSRELSSPAAPTIARGGDAAGGGIPVDMAGTPRPSEGASAGPGTPPATSGTEQVSGGGSSGASHPGSYAPLAERLRERTPMVALSVTLLCAAAALLALRRVARRLT